MADNGQGRHRVHGNWQVRRLKHIAVACAIVLAVAIVVNVAVQLYRSRSRPLFCSFSSAGILSRWSGPRSVLISNHWMAFVDMEDEVILLIPLNRGTLEWLPQTSRSEALKIRSHDERTQKQLEWRRESIIRIGSAGDATYFALSPFVLGNLSRSGPVDQTAVRAIVEKHLRVDE